MSFATTTSPTHTNFQIRPDILELQPSLVQWRRDFHRFPEIGFHERRTSMAIAEKLTAWGIPHQTEIAKTGIVATIVGKKQGQQKVLAIRADMDALPIQEENIIGYKSQIDNMMHACGHDGHTAIALGAAKYLWERADFSGTVKIIFQPAEEGPGGAKPMIEAGVLENPKVDALIGLHIWNNLPLGTVGVRSGALMAATEYFHCKIIGRGGHGALPHQTIDSILVASQVVNAIHAIVSRNVSPLESAVISIGEFHAGSATNVIADSARISGTVRFFNPAVGAKLALRLEETIAGICAAHGASYELKYTKLYPAVINDRAIAELVRSVAETVIETPAGIVPECQTMGGEDVSFFLEAVPGCYFFLGSANPDKGLAYPHHHPRFNFDETVLATGVEIFARCVEKFLT
ncbi:MULTISPECIES: M20 metallopeptidase family protein [Pseudanabaena]|uniref:Amidohydrolase n=2 Tax=Pseudanabaena TaxID=1152 RepID=L8N0R0_9CYAN|nr:MULTISPECIES: amidohydrolase [Pseudanabaena]ELS33772.1 amidohydrolase [Pseudanabaena biceps PCC 7429]MDG3493994.1 amidohydrolase [Pseudanabaena catenata USMAC16]